jgi:4-hydroxybenzoate polyprenyltransferase
LAVSLCQGFLLLALLALPFVVPLGLAYSGAWVLAVVWSYRLLMRLRSRSREDSFWVFRQSHWVGAVIWLGLALDFLL